MKYDIDSVEEYEIEKFKRIFIKFIQGLQKFQLKKEVYKIVNNLYYYLIKKYMKYYATYPDYFYQLNYYISRYNDNVLGY